MKSLEMSWKPFGLTLTYERWDELVTWYVQKKIVETLNKKEEDKNAFKLYSEKFSNGSNTGPKNS
jgi:beta-glucanase (GH16 family)